MYIESESDELIKRQINLLILEEGRRVVRENDPEPNVMQAYGESIFNSLTSANVLITGMVDSLIQSMFVRSAFETEKRN